MQHAVEDADVAARAHRDEEIGGARDRRHARIEHDELRAVLARLPEVVGGDRRALGDVRAGDEDHLRLRDVAPRVGAAIDAEDLLRRRRRRHHAEPAVVVDVGGAQRRRARTCPSGTPSRWSARRRSAPRRRRARRPTWMRWISRAVRSSAASQSIGRKPLRLVAHERRQQAIGVLVLHVALHALRAELALVERKLLPRLEADDLLVLHLELDAALLAAEAAVRRHDPVGLAARGPAAGRLAVEMRAELRATRSGIDAGSLAIRRRASRARPGSARGSSGGTADRRPDSARRRRPVSATRTPRSGSPSSRSTCLRSSMCIRDANGSPHARSRPPAPSAPASR